MKPRYAMLAALAATCLVALAAAPQSLPAPWVVTGPAASKFEAGVDQAEGVRGAKFIRNASGDARVWAALAQGISAQNYRGQRVRFSARIRTEDVSNWAGLWMRVDRAGKSVAFYNSIDKPIQGTTGWQERSVVLDVPTDADTIVFGVIDSGKGQVWIDTLAFEQVGPEVPVDRMPSQGRPSLPVAPAL
ncbi:MAG: transcriptional regulator [Telluria sp.]